VLFAFVAAAAAAAAADDDDYHTYFISFEKHLSTNVRRVRLKS